MFNGNVYGLVIALLTFVIAIVLTMRQIEQRGVHFEVIIRPLPSESGPSPLEIRQSIARRITVKPLSVSGKRNVLAETTIEKRH